MSQTHDARPALSSRERRIFEEVTVLPGDSNDQFRRLNCCLR
jgi:hypothetical protein